MSQNAIELNQQRVITLQGKTSAFVLTCRRVAPEDWAAFYDAISITKKREGADQVSSYDYETPSLVLADRVIVDAEGYKLDVDTELTAMDKWQQFLPLAHRLAVGNALANVKPSQRDEDELIYTSGTPVYIDAAWNLPDDGGMAIFSELKHVFNSPSEAQHRRYAREASRSVVLGGSRAGTTLYPGAQQVLAALYDELIVSVDGYTVNGKLLVGREAIAREMDTHHKVAAVQEMFNPKGFVAATIEEGSTQV